MARLGAHIHITGKVSPPLYDCTRGGRVRLALCRFCVCLVPNSFRFAHPAEANAGVLSRGFVKCWALAFSLGLSRRSWGYQPALGAGPRGPWRQRSCFYGVIMGHWSALTQHSWVFKVSVVSLERLGNVLGRDWGVSKELLGGPHGAWHSLEKAWWLHGDPCSIAGGMYHAKMLLPQLWEAYFQDMCF